MAKFSTIVTMLLGGAALGVLFLTSLAAIFWRYVLNDPIFGVEDITSMALVAMVAASVVFVALSKRHVSVGILDNFLDAKRGRWLVIAVGLASAAMAGFAAYALIAKAMCGFDCGAFTNNLNLPHFPFYVSLAVAFVCFALLQLRGILHQPQAASE